MTPTKLFFKHEYGYINIDDDKVYFSSTSNWSDMPKLTEKAFGEVRSSNSKNTITFILFGIAMIFLFGVFQRLAPGGFGIIAGIIGCALMYKRLSSKFFTEMGERFMIPREKLVSLQSTGESNITFEFTTLDGQVSTYEIEGLSRYGKYKIMRELGIEEITIHPFVEDYAFEVQDLIIDIQHYEFGIPITIEEQPDLMDIPGFYQQNNGNFWVAFVGEDMAGTISLLDIGNGRGALRKMFVAAPYRGKEHGVGQALLNHLMEWAKEKQFSTIWLGTTEKFLAAQRFYEKNGFVEVPMNELPPEFPIMKVDVKFYKYNLALIMLI